MVCTSRLRNKCKLFNKLIFFDTNFIFYIVEAISKDIDLSARNWRGQLNNFERVLQYYLDKPCECSSLNKICTSNAIINTELDPTKSNTSIRRKSRFFQRVDRGFSGSISSQFYSRIWHLMSSRIEIISTLNEDIEFVRNLGLNRGLSYEDLSLIVSSVKKSSESVEACIITGDVKLEHALNDIRSMRNLELPSGRVDTNRILPLNLYTYISFLHKCCHLSNAEHYMLFKHLVGEDMERGPRMRYENTRIKRSLFDKMFDIREDTIRFKETQAT